MPLHQFAAIGECMIEFSSLTGKQFAMNFAGDTLNTALYFARESDLGQVRVHYATALGNDPYSEQMLKHWHQEGIQIDFVQRLPDRLPGLYLIHNSDKGDREFYYYRSQSAAREMFNGIAGDILFEQLIHCDTLYLSSISLAILSDLGREKLLQLLHQAYKKGITICFDTNYRPKLWADVTIAKKVINQVLKYTRIALPSFEDERCLHEDSSPQMTAERLHQAGVSEVIVKQGEQGYLISDKTGCRQIPIQRVKAVIDTTAAGDSFNGAYLAARIKGYEPTQAAQMGANLAATVITHRGAIVPVKSPAENCI